MVVRKFSCLVREILSFKCVEIKSICDTCFFFTPLDRDTAANLLLKKQLTDMKDENETLKNTVHRLTVEFSDFQAKHRVLKPEERSVSPHIQSRYSTIYSTVYRVFFVCFIFSHSPTPSELS